MKLTRRIAISLLSILVISVAVVWIWLLHTSSGAVFVWAAAKKHIDGELSAMQIDGDFSSGFNISNLSFSNESIQVLTNGLNVSVDLDLIPLSLTIETMELVDVRIRLKDGDRNENTPELEIAELLAALRLPVKVNVARLRIDGLSLTNGTDSTPWTLSSLTLTGSLKDRLVVEQLAIVSEFGNASADLSMDLSMPYTTRLSASASNVAALTEAFDASDFTATLDGDNDNVDFAITSAGSEVKLFGKVGDVLGNPNFDVNVRSPTVIWPLQLGVSVLTVTDITAKLQGTIDSFAAEANAQLEFENSGPVAISIKGSALSQQFVFDDVQLQGDRVRANASGSVGWNDSLVVSATSEIGRLDPQFLIESWPAGFPVNGVLEFDWQKQNIQVRKLELEIDSAGTNVQASGEISTVDGVVDGTLLWSNLRWPLNVDVAAIKSSSGEVSIAGKPSAWSAKGQFAVQAANLPAGSVTASANGDLDSVDIDLSDSAIFCGSIGGHASFNRGDQDQFAAIMDFSNLRIDWLWPEWPGDLTGSLEVDGDFDPLRVDINIADMHGTLREQAAFGNGGVSVAEGNVEFSALNINHGESTISVDGNAFSSSGVEFEFALHDLQSYIEDASGTAKGRGTLSLDGDKPYVRINAVAKNVAFENMQIDAINVSDKSAESGALIDQRLTVSGLMIADNVIDEVLVSVTGDPANHDITASVVTEFGDLDVGVEGMLANWRNPTTLSWQGTLKLLDVDVTDTLRAGLENPAALAVSTNAAKLEPACLMSEKDERLCVGWSWAEQNGNEGNVSLTDFSLDVPLAFAGSEIEVTQKMSGEIRLRRNAEGLLNGVADLKLSPGLIRSRSDPDLSTDTDAGAMGFAIENGNLGSGYFDLPFPGLGVIDIDFSVNDLHLGTDSQLSGAAIVDLTDMGLLANVFPFIDSAGGQVKTNLSVTGSVSKPQITGELSLSDASIANEQLGASFSAINVDAVIHEGNRLDLNGTFRARDGSATIKSSVSYADLSSSGFELEINGRDLTLIDMPDLSVVANTDLRVGLHNRALQLDGELIIPKAMIRPRISQNLHVSESEDVVIIAGDVPGANAAADAGHGWTINGEVRVELGDEVRVDLGVANARLGGAVDFEWQEHPVPVARGTYTIDGTIAAIGQVLTISQGMIRFPAVPANNPHLNIRAEREIFGNSQIRSAGVRLTGTAESPVMEAYTVPLTTEERALTLLATGSDFDYEEGVGAIDFGTYVAPKLFLSYGIGVFDRENVISARYDLKKGFGIKATSGKRESGLDVNYRIEN